MLCTCSSLGAKPSSGTSSSTVCRLIITGGNTSPSSTRHEIQTRRYHGAVDMQLETLSSTSLHVCHSCSYTPLPLHFNQPSCSLLKSTQTERGSWRPQESGADSSWPHGKQHKGTGELGTEWLSSQMTPYHLQILKSRGNHFQRPKYTPLS